MDAKYSAKPSIKFLSLKTFGRFGDSDFISQYKLP